MKRIENERDDTENVEVSALGRGPASQQNVEAYAEIDQRDQAQAAVERTVGGSQNQRRLYRDALPNQRVVGFRPDANAIELALLTADVGYIPAIDGQQPIPELDSSFLAGAIGIDPLGPKMAAIFYPPNAIIWGKNFTFFLKIDPSEDDGGNGEQRQENGEKPGLQVSNHRSRWLMGKTHQCTMAHRPIFIQQLGCHGSSHFLPANPQFLSSFRNYRSGSRQIILFLVSSCEILNRLQVTKGHVLLVLVTLPL